MTKTITIDPVTRIEGHSKITISLDDRGQVTDARFHVTQFRGFEKMTEGRPFYEMPSLTARICGICPVSHLIASSKACDDLLAVEIPETASKLRKIINLAQMIQSHALSFFHLSSPDIVFGFDADPADRNIFGVLKKYPDLAKDGIMLRKFGQEVIELLGGKRIHPAWVVPGGVNAPLKEVERNFILERTPDALERILRSLDWYKGIFGGFDAEIRTFANFPSLFMHRLLRWQSPHRGRDGQNRRRWPQPEEIPGIHRRIRGTGQLSEIPVLQTDGLPGWHLPRGAARPDEYH
jgi:NAD-reducing hydrogenase large subunit